VGKIIVSSYCDEHVCSFVCVSVCLFASISPHVTYVARSFFGGVAICYVLPVSCMTSHLLIMARNMRREKEMYTKSDSTGDIRI